MRDAAVHLVRGGGHLARFDSQVLRARLAARRLRRSAAPLSVLRLSGKRVSPPWLPRLQSLPQLLLCAASGEYGRYGGDRSSAGDACEATLRRAEAAPCCEAVLETLSAEEPGRPPPLALRPKLWEEPHAESFWELFYDLIIVVAFIRLSSGKYNLTPAGLTTTSVLFLNFWSCWSMTICLLSSGFCSL